MKIIYVSCAVICTLIGAIWFGINTVPEWRSVRIPEKVVSFGLSNGVYFALSDTNTLYACSNTLEKQAHCRPYNAAEQDRQVILPALAANEIEDSTHCQSLKKSLFRFLGIEPVIVDCEVLSYLEDSSIINAAFLVDSEGVAWEWVAHRRGIVSSVLYGAVIGSLSSLVLLVVIALLSIFVRKLVGAKVHGMTSSTNVANSGV